MRCTERKLTPVAFAMARPVQCVSCPGGLEQLSAKIFATIAVVSLAVPGGRVLSRSKASTPASAYLTCQRHTAGRLPQLGELPRLRPIPRPTATRSGHVRCASAGGSGPSQSKATSSGRYRQRQCKLFGPSAQFARTVELCESFVRGSALDNGTVKSHFLHHYKHYKPRIAR